MSIRSEIISKIWRGNDPFSGIPRNLYQRDIQGWGGEHRFLSSAIVEKKPKVIVEVGVWKGSSCLFMADLLRVNAIDGVIIAVDTWLGSSDHWLSDRWFGDLSFQLGYPAIYRKFMNNVLDAHLENYVIPLPLDSLNAAEVLKHYGIGADLIHLDGGHDYESVAADIRTWWPNLNAGGVLVGDDYHQSWPGVQRAFNEAFGETGNLEIDQPKCRVTKSA